MRGDETKRERVVSEMWCETWGTAKVSTGSLSEDSGTEEGSQVLSS